ncbi:MAG: polymer-forming cytoskeletal protein [Nitrospirae bacterium]|nr:polymer-forming cytoskeletal protein [Nitrospirota bacterium]
MNAAVIGKSIVIKGELSGDEDLTVEGTVEGRITLTKNNLLVGADGRVLANVHAQVVTVTGRLEGDITANDRVEITEKGSVTGNIRTPRLVIADGAFFQGSVEMQKVAEVRPIASKVSEQPLGKAIVGVV